MDIKPGKPFSENIIFFDTEFSTLDPYSGELLSIGMVKPGGEELYLDLEFDGEVEPWVKENVLPKLKGQDKLSPREAVEKIASFVGGDKPFLVSFVSQLDGAYLYKLYERAAARDKFPFPYYMVDFASVLFAYNVNPEDYSSDGSKSSLAKILDLNSQGLVEHNALDDAKVLRAAYMKLIEKYGAS